MNISSIFETQNIISTCFVTSYEKMRAELLACVVENIMKLAVTI
jgi:hypothetical protein